MPVTNERTDNKDYPLPVASNFIRDDLPRLREAIQKIDADQHATDQEIAQLKNAGTTIDCGTFE